jgi:hypothetical protein
MAALLTLETGVMGTIESSDLRYPRTGSYDSSYNKPSFRGISGNLLLLFLRARLRPCRVPSDDSGRGPGRLGLMFNRLLLLMPV